MRYAKSLTHCPWPISGPRNSSVPYRVQLIFVTNLVVVSQPRNGSRYGRTKLSQHTFSVGRMRRFPIRPCGLCQPRCWLPAASKLFAFSIAPYDPYLSWVVRLPIKSRGFSPTPCPVPPTTQDYDRKRLLSSNGT